MKKIYLLIVLVVIALIGVAYFRLFMTQTGFRKAIEANEDVFILENADNADIKIIVAKTDSISLDLKGSPDDLSKVRFFKIDDNTSKFSLSEKWQNLSGTITVPEGTLLDIRLSGNSDIRVNDQNGAYDIEDTDEFLIDTNFVSSVGINGGEGISVNSWGDAIVWDTENWDFFDIPGGGSGEEGGNEDGQNDDEDIGGNGDQGGGDCSIGSQAIRNYCCERSNEDESPECSGEGQWVFNNSSRECEYQCDEDEEEDEEEEEEEQQADCSIGSQQVRNNCCAGQNIDTDTPDCYGEWRFNNATRLCEYHCFTEDEIEDQFGGGSGGDTNRFCEDFDAQQEKDECCDFNLKNDLSMGPRPGFPDCIGRWYFDEDKGCSFRCADYYEMQQIIKELRQRAQEEQE